MVQRDLLIQARDAWEFVFRVAMLPFILILTYGFVLPTLGVLPKGFPSQMFAGMVGMSMLITGIHGTAVPFAMDFNNIMHEIEDRLQAPVASATLGLLVGTIIKPNQIAAMFPSFLMPVVFLGTMLFSRQSLSTIPVLQAIVLVNPLVYANEALCHPHAADRAHAACL